MQTKREFFESIGNEERENRVHRPPSEEMLFYQAVADGSIALVQENCDRHAFADLEGAGLLSDDPLTNLKYHFVVTAALITRFCMEAGMPMEEAYTLSDFYIRKMDRCKSVTDIVLLHDRMALEFSGRMLMIKKHRASSWQVAEAVDYVYSHILERITVEDVANAVHVSPTYLSRIFKQEIGMAISDYVRTRKIDLAKNFLRYTDYSLVDIANRLSFSTQSHFIQQFRDLVGMTPKTFRDKNYMNSFQVREKEAKEEE